MSSPLDLDLRVMWHTEQLLAEAEAERLARALPPRPAPGARLRLRLAVLLHALADSLEQPTPTRSYRFSGSVK